MSLIINPNMAATDPPPVMEARRWLEGVTFSPDRPLLNVSQAAPVDLPPLAMREAMAEDVLNTAGAHLYGPVLGLPALRDALAARWSRLYAGDVSAQNIAITSGCNQAFTATLATLAKAGDEVILPTPWYFNHKMALDMGGQVAVPLPTDAALLPDPERARSLITPRTRAIALVTPNNPGGVEYPPELIRVFFDLAQSAGIALILDETYRDFHSKADAPHDLFRIPNWDDTLIQLYSFSKAYRLTGHRVGAMTASPERLAEVEKYLDTVTICPNQLGQRAALWGIRHLDEWLAGERREILSRRAAMETGFAGLNDWTLMGSGAYFAYVAHPFKMASDALAQKMVRDIGVLMLPGTMFMPQDVADGGRQLRIAFANADTDGIADLFERLGDFAP